MKQGFSKMIARPLNRVKIMVWAKLKIGVRDIIVFSLWVIISFIVAFTSFDKLWIRVVVGLVVGVLGGWILMLGEPNKRIYNYFSIFISFLIDKKKYKGGDVERLNPYKSVKKNEIISKEGKSVYVYRIYGNNIGFNLEEDILRKLQNFEQLFQTQGLPFQIVKQERKWDTKMQLESMNSIDTSDKKRKEIVDENKRILKSLNDENNFYENYFIEFASTNKKKLASESETIESSLALSGLNFKQLEKEELALYMIKKFMPLVNTRKTKLIYKGESIDFEKTWSNILENKEVNVKSNHITIGKDYSKIIAIDQLPLHTSLSFLEDIFEKEATQTIMQIRGISSDEGVRMLNKVYREILSRKNSSAGSKLSDSTAQNNYLDSLEELMESIQSSGEELKAVNIWIHIFGKSHSELLKKERDVLKTIKRSRMKADKLFMKQLDGYLVQDLSTLNKIEERNQMEVGSSALSHSWPFTSESFNDITGDFIGLSTGGKPCYLDWRLRDEKQNRHQSNSVIFGATGGGKSTFTKKVIKDEWSRGVTCYILDPENEYSTFASEMGGDVIDLSGKKNSKGEVLRLNPLQVFVGDTENDTTNTEEWFSSHYKFIDDFFSQLLYPGQTDIVIQMSYLKRALQSVYEKRKLTTVKKIESIEAKRWPIISDLWDELRKLSAQGLPEFQDKKLFQDLSERLYDLTSKGTDGLLWDGHTSLDISKNTLTVFNFRSLQQNGNIRLVGAQSYLTFKYMLHVIFLNKEKAEREGKIRNVSVTIDEAHQFINPENHSGVMFAFSLYKRIRKYHGWIRMTTQNIGDFTADAEIKKETSAMINNSEFMFVFKLKPKDISDLDDLIKVSGGLTDGERSFLGSDMSHRYLFFSGNYRTAIKAEYTDFEKNLFGWKNNKGLNEKKQS